MLSSSAWDAGQGSDPDAMLPDRRGVVKPDASPSARALMTLELVRGSPGITADRLAEKLGVSGRAARRYVAVLREAGIPIESVHGRASTLRTRSIRYARRASAACE